MRRIASLLAAATLGCGAMAGLAPRAAAQAGAQSGLVLPGGTAVPLRVVGDVSSATHAQGDRVTLEAAEDVAVAGQVLIPRGAPALAEVAEHRAKGAFGRSGKLELRLLHVEAGGRLVRLDGVRAHAGKSNAAPAIASGIVVASVLGAVIKGKHAVVPAGTRLTGYVHRDVRVQPAR